MTVVAPRTVVTLVSVTVVVLGGSVVDVLGDVGQTSVTVKVVGDVVGHDSADAWLAGVVVRLIVLEAASVEVLDSEKVGSVAVDDDVVVVWIPKHLT